MRIAVIGGGGWGLALARILALNDHQVLIWEFNAQWLKTLQETHANPALLPNITLPHSVQFTGSFEELAAWEAEVIVLATPTQFIRSTLESIPPHLQERIWLSESLQAIVNVAKGIEQNTLLRIDQILMEVLPPAAHHLICALSGPSHAEEVSREIPTTVVVAGHSQERLIMLQQLFSNSWFRVYRTEDLIGVEIGGAVKNVIAIAAGILAGLGFGDNSMGALLTRGIVEISRLGLAQGARTETFLGLSGIGDLITTSISPNSRNRHVGVQIGKGRKLADILSEMKMVAEGVASTRSVYELAQRYKVEMPITQEVYYILFEDKDPHQAIYELMTRELKEEAVGL
ncbi:MAG: NAD(P)-dependent glycerol-3-phosphate dehydrogenase [Candidatus Cloacimonetes bacterium]|nr:NAD(P)-dependent glycerol-3-phosphate dehydrogenase [Candidatus Cloacimonadota bacterium]NLO11790.1 NAD(P)-dependent glycerol-3-phosphate dehydrogenase [Candidatus Cloacimonadota bacterium]